MRTVPHIKYLYDSVAAIDKVKPANLRVVIDPRQDLSKLGPANWFLKHCRYYGFMVSKDCFTFKRRSAIVLYNII